MLIYSVGMTVTGCFEQKMEIFVLQFYVKYFFHKKKKYLGLGVKIELVGLRQLIKQFFFLGLIARISIYHNALFWTQ